MFLTVSSERQSCVLGIPIRDRVPDSSPESVAGWTTRIAAVIRRQRFESATRPGLATSLSQGRNALSPSLCSRPCITDPCRNGRPTASASPTTYTMIVERVSWFCE